jgi:hypothetical protein
VIASKEEVDEQGNYLHKTINWSSGGGAVSASKAKLYQYPVNHYRAQNEDPGQKHVWSLARFLDKRRGVKGAREQVNTGPKKKKKKNTNIF